MQFQLPPLVQGPEPISFSALRAEKDQASAASAKSALDQQEQGIRISSGLADLQKKRLEQARQAAAEELTTAYMDGDANALRAMQAVDPNRAKALLEQTISGFESLAPVLTETLGPVLRTKHTPEEREAFIASKIDPLLGQYGMPKYPAGFWQKQENIEGIYTQASALVAKNAKAKQFGEATVMIDGVPTVVSYDQQSGAVTRVGAAPPKSGMRISQGPNGELTVDFGGGTTVATQTEGQKALGAVSEQYQNLLDLRKMMNDEDTLREATTYLGRGMAEVRAQAQKIGADSMVDTDKMQKMEALMSTSQRAATFLVFGEGGKSLTKSELEQLSPLLPKLGTSWTDMDFASFDQFKTRLDAVTKWSEIAQVRAYIMSGAMPNATPDAIAKAFPYGSEQYNAIRDALFIKAEEERVAAHAAQLPPGERESFMLDWEKLKKGRTQ